MWFSKTELAFISTKQNLAISGVMAIKTSCSYACMSSRMWNYHLFDHWVMCVPYCSIVSVHSNFPLSIPRPLTPPTEQIHSTGSFSRTFSVWVHWMCLLWAYGCGEGVLNVCASCEHLSQHHFTRTIFKCPDKNIQFKPIDVEEKHSSRAGTRALAFAFLFSDSVQGTMTTCES